MKMNPSCITSKSVLLAAILCVAGSLSASAQILSASGTNLNVTSISTTSLDGYIFYSPTTGTGGGSFNDLSSLPGYLSLGTYGTTGGNAASDVGHTISGSTRYAAPYSSLTIDGTAYRTGIDYSNHTAPPTSLGTITLTGTIPNSITFGFLLDNTGGGSMYSQTLTLTLETYLGATIGTPVNLETSTPTAAANDFYYATLTNAVAGDQIVITGVPNTTGMDTEIGGITFSSSSIPEPSSWALMLGGFGLLAFWSFRRSARA